MITTTPYLIIESEYAKNGIDEFSTINDRNGRSFQQLHFNDGQTPSLIAKVARYDDDIASIVDNTLFAGYTLPNQELDRFFKRMFISRFSHRELKYQTMERWQQVLISSIMSHEQVLKVFWDNLDKYISGELITTTSSDNKDGSNFATQELPQDSVTADLTKNILEYADSNNVTRGFSNSNNTSSSKQFNTSVLFQFNNFWVKLLDELDDELFLHVW